MSTSTTSTEHENEKHDRTDAPGAPTAAPRTTERTARRRRRRRRLGAITALLVAGIVGCSVRGTAPVGHFVSAHAHDAYRATYERAMAELPEPDAVLDLRTDYGVVRMYRFDGANPEAAPLVLLPGRASASPVWADNLPSLRELRTVYTIDLLGEPGASVQSRPIRTDDDQAAWLHQALARLPEPELHLLGMSIGGWTAMNLAIRSPEKIATVSLLDPAMTFADMPFETIVRSIPATVRWFPKSWRDSFTSWTAGGFPVEDVPVADMIEAGMQGYSLRLPNPARFSTEQLGGVRVPVLAIIAGESVMHDAAAAAQQAEQTLPDATVVTYPGASHAINGEHPDEIAADLEAFLRTHEQPTAGEPGQ